MAITVYDNFETCSFKSSHTPNPNYFMILAASFARVEGMVMWIWLLGEPSLCLCFLFHLTKQRVS